MLNTIKRNFIPLVFVAIAASLSSCSSSPTSFQGTANEIANSVSKQTPSMAQLRAKSANPELSIAESSVTDEAVTPKTENVIVYTSDVQCQELVAQKVSVPSQEAVTGSVGKILEQTDSADLSLSGYRVNVKNGIATVDFRVSPGSKRQLGSLSSCEQFALFGSLRKTLTSNAQWQIKHVRFTEKGEDIAL